MSDRLLYRIRNVGKRHASYGVVVGEASLVLEVNDPSFVEFLAQIKVEDLTIPGHANVKTTQKFQEELPSIINGTNKRWHLWEACVYRHRLVLHFANKQTKGGRSKAAALKCYLEWPVDLEMRIFVPDDRKTFYQIKHLAPDERFDLLQVEYDNEDGLVNTETFETGPKRRKK